MLALLRALPNAPNTAALLGFELLEVRQRERQVLVGFVAKPDFTNPMGHVQGGILTAMLDDAMAVAGVMASGLTAAMPTIELKVSFLRPAQVGPLRATGEVLQLGKSVAFLAGRLHDLDGRLLASASATAMPRSLPG